MPAHAQVLRIGGSGLFAFLFLLAARRGAVGGTSGLAPFPP